MRSLISAFLVVFAVAGVARGQSGADHVRVELLADTTAVQPGKLFTVGVRFKIDPGWHIYWTNPGDSGLPTRVKLTLPDGFAAGPVQYPTPSVIRQAGNETMYGYTDEAVLLVPVTPPASMAAGATAVSVVAKATYLVCQDVCLPGQGTAKVELPVSSGAANKANESMFRQAAALMPRDADADHIRSVTSSTLATAGGPVTCRVDVTWTHPPSDVQFAPDVVAGWDVGSPTVKTDGAVSHMTYALTAQDGASAPVVARGVLSYVADGQRIGVNCVIKFVRPPPPAPSR